MSDKIKMMKWTHEEFGGWLITPASWTAENVRENYLEDGLDGPQELPVGEEVLMTQAEIDALPEFDG